MVILNYIYKYCYLTFEIIIMNKILFSDFTFLFPIQIDSMDRYQNLNIVINFLKHHLGTQIIVLEAYDFQHIDSNRLPTNTCYHLIQDSSIKFHRTHSVNKLIKRAITPYGGIWDTGVLIPIPQLMKAIQLLRKQERICILPYDGTCYSLNHNEKQDVKKQCN